MNTKIIVLLTLSVTIFLCMALSFSYVSASASENTEEEYSGTLIKYNLLTGEKEEVLMPVTNLTLKHPGEYKPENLSYAIKPYTIIGIDNRYKINNTTNFPYSAICRIQYKSISDFAALLGEKPKQEYATGVMVAKNVVITAAHVIHINSVTMSEHTVSPGYYNGNNPFGISKVVYAYYPSEWDTTPRETNEDNLICANYDWAVLVLEDNIGEFSGWLEPVNLSSSDLINVTVTVNGYPKDLGMFEYQYESWGQLCGIFSKRLEYYIDTFSGQSGSPIFNLKNQVVGVHGGAYQYLDSSGKIIDEVNKGARINNVFYNKIIELINQYK